MASLTTKDNSPFWIACITLPDGNQTQKSTKIPKTGNRKEAQKIADEYEAIPRAASKRTLTETHIRKVINDCLEGVGHEPVQSDTVETYLRDWLKKYTDSTKERYEGVVDLFLAHLGNKAKSFLPHITHKDILGFKDTRTDFAPNTVNTDIKILNIAFNQAKKLHFIDSNPVEKALTLNPIGIDALTKEAFTPEQIGQLLDVASEEWRTVILFGYYIGARLTDCARMQWSNVNFTQNTVKYLARKTRRKNIFAEIPMAPQLQAHLEKLAHDTAEQFITPDLAKKDTRGAHGLSETFKGIMLKAKIDPKIVEGKGKRKFSLLSFHSLRHTANSLLANNGVDQETRMQLIGWKSKDINDGYTHHTLTKLRDAVSKLPSIPMK